ncbi:MAG: potassium channel protein [Leptolyngbya sp. SIO3F4]|nr:potassium channel protein [Leptolyngbya sp. SIO3F4]
MEKSLQRIVIGVGFFVSTVIVAVIGYVAAGWTLMDAIYMVVITIFGVGYGEVKPLESNSLKLFTILVIIAGVISVTYIISGVVQSVAAGEIRQALSLKRMSATIANLKGHVIICGYGRIGQLLCQQLKKDGLPFIVVDADPQRVSLGQEEGYLMHLGNATDEASLEAVGVHRARALATVLPDDAANVFITLTARELNNSITILARGELPSTEKKLRLAGADHVVLPATISAGRMANLLINPAAEDFLSQGEGRNALNQLLSEIDIQLSELPVESQSNLVGATIRDIETQGHGTFIIVALRRQSGEILIHPSQDTFLAPGDALILMGHQGDLPSMIKRQLVKPKLAGVYRGQRWGKK